ncbi:hypothetical protein F2Q70_00022348 [Brassica cretica]|uniref:Uncharacterized protein n=1 Tax=Brassica cretica TaxID=69181 RepID=A0A8S9GVT6_BRACR|nr:hypothetical protein F2Q70_00022348 [Brassica cretica]
MKKEERIGAFPHGAIMRSSLTVDPTRSSQTIVPDIYRKHEIELQGVDGEFRLWEKEVRVFERERERAGEYHRLQNMESSFKVSTERFGCGRKG